MPADRAGMFPFQRLLDTLRQILVMSAITTAGSFCEQMFLEPKMKIFVQGSEVKTEGLLSSLGKKETFAIDISNFLDEAENGDPPPPYNITVQVSRWSTGHTPVPHRPLMLPPLVGIQALKIERCRQPLARRKECCTDRGSVWGYIPTLDCRPVLCATSSVVHASKFGQLDLTGAVCRGQYTAVSFR